MKITLLNTWNKIRSKKGNIAWLVFGLIIVMAIYNFFNKTKLPILQFKMLASNDNYLLYLVGTLVVGMFIYRTLNNFLDLNIMQKFTFRIKSWQIALMLIGFAFISELIILGAPLKTIYKILNYEDYKYIIGLLFFSNLINYSFSINPLGKILSLIALIITKLTYMLPNGFIIYGILAFVTFLITFTTQDRYNYQFTTKMNFLFLVRNKFFEAVIYMFRYTKTISIYISFTLVLLYTALPQQYQIHYQIGEHDISYYVQIISIFSLLYIALSGLIFTRENNLYVKAYNPFIYTYWYIFNALYFALMAYISALGHKHNVQDVLYEGAYELQSVLGIFLVSAVIRKRNILTVFISILVTGIIQQRISNTFQEHLILTTFNAILIALAIFQETFFAFTKKIKLKNN